jgi:hypothetical protein
VSQAMQVSGYDKRTERLAVCYRLPGEIVSKARDLAHVAPDDDGEGAYRLEAAAAIALGRHMDTRLNPDLYDWVLEPALRG